MTKQRSILYFASAVLLFMVLGLSGWQMGATKNVPLSFSILSGGTVEQLELWESEDGTFYAFLPSYAELSQVEIILNNNQTVYINGKRLEDGMDCSTVAVNTPCEFSYAAWGRMYHQTIVFLCSDNVAAMFIETQSGSLDYIHAEKGNKESGSISVYTPNGELDFRGDLESIQGRGNFTWLEYEKKPYSLSLANEADLLSLGAAQKWILLANAGDPTNLRNKIIYDFAADVGLPYSPESKWVDLYVNGEYTGLYLLTERNEVHKQRVNISNDDSFLVSQEISNKLEAQNIASVRTEALQTFRIHYPLVVSDQELREITTVLQSAEHAILSADGVDPTSGKHWSELIDVNSWARKYLLEEVVGNSDAGATSQFYYMNGAAANDKIYAGPVWDYDRSMGNAVAWQLLSPNTFYANRIHVNGSYDTPWLAALYEKEEFCKQLKELYKQDFLPAVEKLLREDIYAYVNQIEAASALNQVRWFDMENDIGMQTEAMIAYMRERIAFLNKIWLEEMPYYRVLADQSFGANYVNYIVFEGAQLTDLYMFEDTEFSHFVGWYYKDTNEPFDITQPITKDIEIYAKWENTGSNKLDNVLKLIPLGAISVMGIVLLWTEYKRIRKSR